MMTPEALNTILERITQKQQTDQDMEVLRRSLRLVGDSVQWVSQDGKFNTNVGQITGGAVHIGDRIYQGASAEAIRDIIQSLLQELQAAAQPTVSLLKSVDALVQQVRSRLHDDIQRLHGTMPLWGVDHWVPLGDLFVDVNILEELSSSRRSELADLWQDFSQNPNYRSLDRIGLGRERQRVSGQEILAKHTSLMVVGKPGSGKTTYLQRVVTECNAGNLQAHKIPVLIRLREFVEDGRDIAYSLERYLEHCWQLAAAETQLMLSQGRSLLLLDGLDEVTGEDGKTITKQIKRFARAYPKVQMVMTCRTQSQESRFERFDYMEVADFNEPQVRAFAEHWFQTVCADQGAGQAKAQVFLDQLFQAENKPIHELALTPILLSLTCAVFQQKQAFYSKRSRLYEEGLELLLEQWDKSREIERDELYQDLSVERKLELLSYLAVKKFEQEQYVLFEQVELEGHIAEFLGIGLRESRGVLKAIESQHGLLIERSQKIWSFSHLTFQEYLVAKWFCDRENWQDLAKHMSDFYWKQVLLLGCEIGSKSVDILIYHMKQEIDTFYIIDGNFQQFLKWVSKKAGQFKSPIKQAMARAFYLCWTTTFESCIKNPREYNESLIRNINRIIDMDQLTNINHAFNEMLTQEISMVKLFEIPTDIFLGFGLSLNYSLSLKQALKNLLGQVPSDAFNGQRFEDRWWDENQPAFIKKFRDIINLYSDIGYDWHFTDFEEARIQRYWDMNVLLVDCLNGNYKLSKKMRRKIEETLLLPIAEIEKRKREKVE